MEQRAKLYGAMSHAPMEEGQIVEEHGYPDEHLDEHDLDDGEYEYGYIPQWEGDTEEEEEIAQEQSTGHDLIGEHPEGEEYAEEFSEFVEFDDEEEAKRYIAKLEGVDLIEEEEELIEENGEGSNQYMEEEVMHDDSEGPLYNMYQHTTGRRATIHQCEVCGVVVKHPSKIAAHMRTHTGERPFHCDICGRSFTQRTPWRMHMKRHAQDLPFPCSSGCGKAFPNASQRNAHDLRHMGRPRQGQPRPHLKPQKRQFIPNGNLLADRFDVIDALIEDNPPVIDVRDHHLELGEDAHNRIDEVINAVAENREVRHVPIKAKAPVPTAPPEVAAARRPKTRRAPPIVAECQICGLLLKHPSKIQAHMRSHSGVKLHKCQYCGLSVATNYALRMHVMRKHTEGDRPIPCQWECGKKFVSVSAKNEHEKIVHGGYKRYVCKVGGCYRLFARRSHYLNHKLKDHAGLNHVDEFGDAIDQDLEMSEMVREADERTNYPVKVEDEEAEENDGGEEEREAEERTEQQIHARRMLELGMPPSPLLRREREDASEDDSSSSPPILRREEVSILPLVPRLPMKIARIVRRRGGMQ
ncbi:hypothetical protein PMAYCL1PPCAC_23372 [Pristionchus mayeri]|uniref:C2H2-type domain-containing protein n=1 Tax=Pristionchus mayeri TaxID=1317129 RepID=A0AAN5CZ48_9BILA|nr:hypothetical protein PMAYCL1PPCAC_23372 [Pristionchus mayeri]